MVGDIYDRGPYPHLIMDTLMSYHSVDIQWGNHDVLWMGAAAGNPACIANVLRISAKYGNLDILEDGYGINLVPLARFAMTTYHDDPCTYFQVEYDADQYNVKDAQLDEKMHKAIAVIQFKLEGKLIDTYPEFDMQERKLLHKMDLEKGTVEVEGVTYPLRDTYFPTIDPEHPYDLSAEEQEVVNRLTTAFINCEKLQKHVRFLFTKGSLYKVCNGKLLIIDGGFSRAYRSKTGIAGYTLIFDSYGLILAAHEPFESVESAVVNGTDIHSHNAVVSSTRRRLTVADTDRGAQIKEEIEALESLLRAYRSGLLVEEL